MQNAADKAEEWSDGPDDANRSVVADLAGLMEHMQASLELIESTIARELTAAQEDGGDVFVLDDVTPGYVKAGAALRACGAGLIFALHLLRETAAAGVVGRDAAREATQLRPPA
jgi:hypothetical protein